MDITTQLIEAERIVCRIEKDPEVALELYQDLCLTCLENGDVDWSRSQVGRIVRIVQRLRVTRFRRTAVRQSQCIDRIGPDVLLNRSTFAKNRMIHLPWKWMLMLRQSESGVAVGSMR